MTQNHTKTGADVTKAKAASARKAAISKKARLEVLLRRQRGATMAQLAKSLGWQPHTVRAAISRLRKSGADVSIDKSGKVSAYRIADVA
jgi:DNA-binding transcriptional regulator PaaX